MYCAQSRPSACSKWRSTLAERSCGQRDAQAWPSTSSAGIGHTRSAGSQPWASTSSCTARRRSACSDQPSTASGRSRCSVWQDTAANPSSCQGETVAMYVPPSSFKDQDYSSFFAIQYWIFYKFFFSNQSEAFEYLYNYVLVMY